MLADQIQRVRRFNRIVTQRVGALEESYLRRDRPLGEARLIFEVGLEGADIRALRGRLGLDSGYLSRLLRSLEAQGLAAVHKQAEDNRIRRVSLTPQGREEFATYERLSDGLAEAMLAPLDLGQRDRLIGAMAEVERQFRATAVEISVAAPDSADARWCLDAYFAELAKRFESGFDPVKGNAAEDAEMAPPEGCFVVARLDGEPVGCGGLKCKDKTAAEIKRMWTAPSARGLGVARRILRTLENLAQERGFTAVRLDTNRALNEAHALYRSQGYSETAPFSDHPYAHLWFAKRL